MQKNQKLLLILAAVLVTVFCATFYFKVNQKIQIDTINIETETQVTSKKLIAAFLNNESDANLRYVEKAIEIQGVVKEVTYNNDRCTIFLQGDTEFSSVMCVMKKNQYQEIQKLKKGQSVILKGVCKGFLMDVIFLDGIIVNSRIDE
jgi:hypothetical protein